MLMMMLMLLFRARGIYYSELENF